MQTDPARYPIGRFQMPDSITPEDLASWIQELASFPERLAGVVQPLNDAQLDTPYRDGGWTVRQVIHHCADSHMNSFMRYKLALTEKEPTIRPYHEAQWADLPDSRSFPIDASLQMLTGIHRRWVALLRSLSTDQWEREFVHPENRMKNNLVVTTAIYVWHGNHHMAQIVQLMARMGWR